MRQQSRWRDRSSPRRRVAGALKWDATLPLDDAARSAEPLPALLADKRVEPVESDAASRERAGT
jgi:hypothetical protein